MGVAELNRVKYSGLDFDSHFDDLQIRMQIRFAADFNDFALSSLGIMLVDLISFGLDSLSFYMDRRATDMYLETARSRKSVSRLTRQIGYKMRASIAASVDLDVSIDDTLSVTVVVPEGFKFNGPNDLIFEAAQNVEWTPVEQLSGIVKKIPCYQGESFTETFVSDGTANQIFSLRRVPEDNFIVAGSVVVTVDGGMWEENEFLTFDTTDQYEIGFNDDPPNVRFGDSVAGNIPGNGTSIVVDYVASRGKSGNVVKSTITEETNPLIVNFQNVNITVNNSNGSSGGDDPEDLTHAKIFAGQVYKSRFVAVTRNDYEALSGSFADPLFGRVAVAQAFSSRSASTDLLLQTLLSDIQAVINPIKPAVDSSITNVRSVLDSIDALLVAQGTTLEGIAMSASDADSNLDTVLSTSRDNRNRALEIGAQTSLIINGSSDVGTNSALVRSVLTGLPTAASALSSPDLALLEGYLNSLDSGKSKIDAEVVNISATAGIIETDEDTILSGVGSAKDSLGDIGLTTTDINSKLLSAATTRTEIQSQLGIQGSPSTGIRLDLDTISDTVVILDTGVDTSLQAIEDHVDRILSADCKANLVTVPILTRDAGGFYTAPSISLIAALQRYLDDRKEVTQTVEVVSGASSLIPAVLEIRLGVRALFSESVIATEVETALNAILKDRRFGDSLYLSNVRDIIRIVPGVEFSNAIVQGHIDLNTGVISTARLDVSGNLVIPSSEVVTRGSISITTELATSSTNTL